MVAPLGLDIGSQKLRLVAINKTSNETALKAVVSRALPEGAASSGTVTDPEFIGAILADAWQELGMNEKRCVCSVGAPEAIMLERALPPMTGLERRQAICLDVSKDLEYSLADAAIASMPLNESRNSWAVGVIPKKVLFSRVSAIRRAGLRPIAVDYDGFAIFRALPRYAAVLDIGFRRSTFHMTDKRVIRSIAVSVGGANVTDAISRGLLIDEQAAEKRKKILGSAGVTQACNTLVESLIRVVRSACDERTGPIALVGNGVRVAGLAETLSRMANVRCEFAVSDLLRGEGYPEDILRSNAPDWTLAAGLGTWKAA